MVTGPEPDEKVWHDGFVAQYPGDGILVYFGYPQARENDVENCLRAARASLRASGESISGHAMAKHLLRYSERGHAYVEEIQSMIRINKLATLDQPPPTQS